MIKLKSISIENFKSIEKLVMEARDINVIIGKNGTGKTRLLEAIKLISDCIAYDNPSDYPFLKWWGYDNVVHRQMQQNPISFSLQFSIDNFDALYSATISGAGGSMRFIEERISVDNMVDIQRHGT